MLGPLALIDLMVLLLAAVAIAGVLRYFLGSSVGASQAGDP